MHWKKSHESGLIQVENLQAFYMVVYLFHKEDASV
jgi:hypothetical protein